MTAHRASIRSLILLASVACLCVAGGAQAATNLVPNPGFELNCAGTPCGWLLGSWSTVNPHSGTASMQLTKAQNLNFVSLSDCVAATPGTVYAFSLWYRTADADVGQAGLSATYFSTADCTGSNVNTGGASQNGITRDGMWHQISGSATSPSGTQSARLILAFGCADPGCPVGATGNFDDLDMQPATTAVAFGSATARRTAGGVVLGWNTASEANVLGFDVYRQAGERRVRLNAHLIPAGIAVTGQRYSFLDRRAPARPAVRYWIRAVDAQGTASWYGPVLAPRV